MKDDRAPSLDLSGLSLSPSIWLRSGSPAAPGVICLRLLPSGPDRVHNTPLHRTQPSTLFAEERSNLTKPQHWEFSPAAADCGLQGTATSPPSTIITSLLTGFSKAPLEGQKPFYTTTGTPHPSEHMNGEGGIRTHGTLLAPTRSPGAPNRPLSHLSKNFSSGQGGMAEREGFEPPVPARAQLISNQPPSTTRPSLRWSSPRSCVKSRITPLVYPQVRSRDACFRHSPVSQALKKARK